MAQNVEPSPCFFIQTRDGLENRRRYSKPKEGSDGVYFMKDSSGEKTVSVFKPKDEERYAVNHHLAPRDSQTLSISGSGKMLMERAGKGVAREVAAFLLDHPPEHRRELNRNRYEKGFSGVPPTMLIRCSYIEGFFCNSKEGEWKLGSLQEYAGNVGSCSSWRGDVNTFPVGEVHKICVHDMRLANSDRNGTNVLVQKHEGGVISLLPIDHGLCFPDSFDIKCKFYWLRWPQSKMKFSQETLDYIAKLDAGKDIELLESDGFKVSDGVARVFHVYTMLLKKGAELGLSPYDIGSLMEANDEPVIKKIAKEAEEEGKKENEEEVVKVLDEYLKQYIEDAERMVLTGTRKVEAAKNEFGKKNVEEAERMGLTGMSDELLTEVEEAIYDFVMRIVGSAKKEAEKAFYEYLKTSFLVKEKAEMEGERTVLAGSSKIEEIMKVEYAVKFIEEVERIMVAGKNKIEDIRDEYAMKFIEGAERVALSRFLKKVEKVMVKYLENIVEEKAKGGRY